MLCHPCESIHDHHDGPWVPKHNYEISCSLFNQKYIIMLNKSYKAFWNSQLIDMEQGGQH
jgi:hypothetical protein